VSGYDDVVGDLAEQARSSGALVLGSGFGPVAMALQARAVGVKTVEGDWPSMQLSERVAVVVLEPTVPPAVHEQVAMVHCGVQHLLPGGSLVVPSMPDTDASPASRFALTEVTCMEVGGGLIHVYRRTDRRTVHDMVFEARSRIRRITATELSDLLAHDTPPHVIDTRTATDRLRGGVIKGSLHVPRTVLEWHLDPSNGYRHPADISFDEPMVIVCNGGYSSSLAAANLLDLGFRDVSDLIGGHRAWLAADLPVEPADHTHLDL
jgi:rhodanese-related sulfurtransferase